MPLLPTFEVSQSQADRMLAAFGSVEAYKAWLKAEIIQKVITFELDRFDREHRDAREARKAQIQTEMPPV